jgi:hypothetical protein
MRVTSTAIREWSELPIKYYSNVGANCCRESTVFDLDYGVKSFIGESE